jgi:hypothetical protein
VKRVILAKLKHETYYLRRDNTLTGHILGRAQVRGQGPKPERTLTPAYTATIRLILHMSMFIGVGTNPQVY